MNTIESGAIKGIRIVSDGTVTGTRVYDNTGEDVTAKLHIRGIRWTHCTGGIPTAELTCSLSAIEGTVPEEGVKEVSDLSCEYREFQRA